LGGKVGVADAVGVGDAIGDGVWTEGVSVASWSIFVAVGVFDGVEGGRNGVADGSVIHPERTRRQKIREAKACFMSAYCSTKNTVDYFCDII